MTSRPLKTEYTVLQVQNPRESGIRPGAMTAACKEVKQTSSRAMNGSLRPGCGNPGAMTARGLTILSHDLPKTVGKPCGSRVKRRLRSYDSLARGGL